jgi:hypothetical protein
VASASLRALLAGSVDYAGLFPPASLPLETALRNQRAYLRDDDVWMLGAFVLPIKKFEEVMDGLGYFDAAYSLRISALGAKAENPAEFMAGLTPAIERIRSLETARGAVAAVVQMELSLPTQAGVRLTEASAALAALDVPVFWEAPADEAERTISFLAERAWSSSRFGFKLRTGGVIASAFPSSIQIARALVAAIAQRVPIKFTAGLHHPVRRYDTSVQTKMHGFLNVFGAGVLAAEHEWDLLQTARVLEDEDPSSFTFDDNFFAWNNWKVSTDRIVEHRKIITSFGSCSFDEPREDLRELNLL